MKIVLGKMMGSVILLLSVFLSSNAQNSNNRDRKNSNEKSKGVNTIVEIDLPDSSKPVHHSTEYILNFFLSEARKVKYLSVHDHKKPTINICNIDSLQFVVRDLIDSFVSRTKWWDLGFGENNANNIHNSLDSQFFKPKKQRDILLLDNLKKDIDALSISKEKVDLLLQRATLTIPNNSDYFTELGKVYQEAETITLRLTNDYDMAKAYTYIGDFAKNFQDNYNAIKFYSAARISFHLSSIAPETLQTEDGKLCKKMSEAFYGSTKYIDDYRIFNKITEYLNAAMNDFSSNLNNKLHVETWADKFSADSYILTHFRYSDTSEITINMLSENLNSLYFWYYYYSRGSYSYKVNYDGLFSVGKILSRQNNYKESLVFYLQALPFALQTDKPGYIDGCLSNIVYSYNQLKESEKAEFYTELRHNFNTYYWGDWGECDYLITKATDFYQSNKNDSALSYLNRFLFDTSYESNLLPPDYYSLYKDAVELKFPILYSLQKDSASIYENYFHDYNEWAVQNIASLLQAEAEAKQELIYVLAYKKDSANTVIKDSLKFEANRLARVNFSLNESIAEKTSLIANLNDKAQKLIATNLVSFNKISYAEKSIKYLNIQNAGLKANNQNLVDSIDKSDSILITAIQKNKVLNITNDSLSKINDKLTQKTKDLKEDIINWGILAMLGLLSALIISIILGLRISNRVKKIKALNIESQGMKSQMEANRIANENELKYSYEKNLKELTIKHEIVGLISELYAGYSNRFLSPGLKTGDIDSKLSEFGKRFKDLELFSRHYYKLLRDDEFNKIDDEVELCKRYVEVVKINKGEIVFRDLRTIRHADIVLPHHCLNGFTKNSIENGKVNDEILTISLEDRQDVENYILVISDNGKGLPDNFNLSNLPKESTGLRNILSQLRYFNSKNEIPYTIEFNSDSIANRIIENKIAGVVIKLTFKPKK